LAGEAGLEADEGSSPALASATSISSCVRFLDWRKATRFSRGEADTEGSWRNVTAEETRSSRGAMMVVRLYGEGLLHLGEDPVLGRGFGIAGMVRSWDGRRGVRGGN
jgi:hypothetical protein